MLKIIKDDIPNELEFAVQRISNAPGFWFSVHLYLSKLEKDICTSDFIDNVVSTYNDAFESAEGMLFVCPDNDIILVSKNISGKELRELSEKVVQSTIQIIHSSNTANKASFTPEFLHSFHDLSVNILLFDNECKAKAEQIQKQIQLEKERLEQLKPKPKPAPPPKMYAMDKRAFSNAINQRVGRKKKQILIVEDHAFSRQLIVSAIDINYEVLTARNGAEALHIYSHNAPDIMFLDIGLPELNGHDILKHIISVDKESFIVMLSANSDAENVKGAISNGAIGFIAKPFTKNKLNEYLKKYHSKYSPF